MKTVLTARIDEARIAKVEAIQQSTGLTVSQLFRRLIDAAEVEPLKVTVNLGKAKSAETLQGIHGAFAL